MRFISVGRATPHSHSPCRNACGRCLGQVTAPSHSHYRSLDLLFGAIAGHGTPPLPTHVHLTPKRNWKGNTYPMKGRQTRERVHSPQYPHTNTCLSGQWLAPNQCPKDKISLPCLGYSRQSSKCTSQTGIPAISLSHNHSWPLLSFSYVPSTVRSMLFVS